MHRYLTVIVVLLMAAPAFAQLPAGPSVRVGAHGNFSLSNFPSPEIQGATALKDAYGTGWGGGVHLDARFAGFGVRFQGDYIRYSADVDKFREAYASVFGAAVSQINIDGGDLRIITASANLRMDLFPVIPVVSPYLTGGAGLAWLDLDEARTSIAGVPGNTFPAASQSGRTLLNLGAGVEVTLGLSFFVEGRYVWLMTEGETSTYVPISAGITF
jgi:hypothetical protein